ncbi:unnamed protein product [Calicophoron daubneyi]|uniref:Uncharacterized protein n=1 Tax=Calicophoron daubneyi TaxID=300641 RepID=A0AAV2THX2_CALDB
MFSGNLPSRRTESQPGCSNGRKCCVNPRILRPVRNVKPAFLTGLNSAESRTKTGLPTSFTYTNNPPYSCHTRYNKWHNTDESVCHLTKTNSTKKALEAKLTSFKALHQPNYDHLRPPRSVSLPPHRQTFKNELPNVMRHGREGIFVRPYYQSSRGNHRGRWGSPLRNNVPVTNHATSEPPNRVNLQSSGVEQCPGCTAKDRTKNQTGRSRSYPAQALYHVPQPAHSNMNWWISRSSDRKPPWFPAGKGGTTVSHHRQFQKNASRLRITGVLDKADARSSVYLPKSHFSPCQSYMTIGLENLPPSITSRLHRLRSNSPVCREEYPVGKLGKCVSGGGCSCHEGETPKEPHTLLHPKNQPRIQYDAQRYTSMLHIRHPQTKSIYSRELSNHKSVPSRPGVRISPGLGDVNNRPSISVSAPIRRVSSEQQKVELTDSTNASFSVSNIGKNIDSFNSLSETPCVQSNFETGDIRIKEDVKVKKVLEGSSDFLSLRQRLDENVNKERSVSQEVRSTNGHTISARSLTSIDMEAAVPCLMSESDESVKCSDVDDNMERKPELFSPGQEPFAATNISTASTTHAMSAGPVTYASLWDRTGDGQTQSDEISLTCTESPEFQQSDADHLRMCTPTEMYHPVVEKQQSETDANPQETRVRITEMSDLSTEKQYSSLVSKINSVIFGEEMSVSVSWRTTNEPDLHDLSRGSSWSLTTESEVCHVENHQHADKNKIFLLSEGDCNLTNRMATSDVISHDRPVLISCHRRKSVRPHVGKNICINSELFGKKTAELRGPRCNERSVKSFGSEDPNLFNRTRGRRRFLRKLRKTVRNISANRRKNFVTH